MLDYLSQFQPPSKEEAVSYVLNVLTSEFHTIPSKEMYNLISTEYDNMGSVGSYAAWLSMTSQVLIDRSKKQLTNYINTTDKSNTYVVVLCPDDDVLIGTN
jgi:hypothetical protein